MTSHIRGVWILTFVSFCAAQIITLTGCKSVSKYVSPQITGRVLDEATHLPLEGAAVQRLSSKKGSRLVEPPKGGQLLMQPAPVRTREDGTFVLESWRDLGVFRRSWFSVGLSVQHPGFEEFVCYYTIADATNSPDGVPVVRTGDILLLRSAQ